MGSSGSTSDVHCGLVCSSEVCSSSGHECKTAIDSWLTPTRHALYAGPFPGEWGRPGAFPRLQLLSISHGGITGDALASAKHAGIEKLDSM